MKESKDEFWYVRLFGVRYEVHFVGRIREAWGKVVRPVAVPVTAEETEVAESEHELCRERRASDDSGISVSGEEAKEEL